MKKTAIVWCLTLIALLHGVVSPAAARDVMIEVTSISASMLTEEERASADGTIDLDPRLRPFSKNLRSLFAYERYSFLSKDRTAIEFGTAVPFQLPEHFSLEVAPEQLEPGESNMIEMMVTLYREAPRRGDRGRPGEPEREVVLRTKIRLKNGGTVLLGGPPISSGVLVLALSARA